MIEKESKLLTVLSYVVDRHGDLTEKFLNINNLGSLASARLQLIPAIESAMELGFSPKVLSLHNDHIEDMSNVQKSRLCLIGKMSANTTKLVRNMVIPNLKAIAKLKSEGATIILQHSDNTFHKGGEIASFYKDLFKAADFVIYPSNTLQKITKSYTTITAREFVIPDPWQLKETHKPRKLNKDDILRIIWFGSNKNITYLVNEIESIFTDFSAHRICELTILAQEWAITYFKAEVSKMNINHSSISSKWIIRFVQWETSQQPKQLEQEISRAHISLIPSDPNDPLKAGVSHNRLVDSIRGGCISVASPLESYLELSTLAILGENIADQLQKAVVEYNQISSQIIEDGPMHLAPFAPSQNRLNWLYCWKTILAKTT